MGEIVPSSDLVSGNVVPDSDLVQAPPATIPTPQPSWLGAAKGVGDTALAIGSGGLRAVNSAINDLIPGVQERTEMARQIATDPILNYQPQTDEGKYLMGKIRTLMSPISWAGNTAYNYIKQAAGQRAADVTADVATLAPFAVRDISDIRGMMADKAAAIEQGTPLSSAAEAESSRLAGLKANAEQNGFDLPEGGTAERHAAAAANNQPLVNAAVRDELDLPKNAPLTPQMLAKARATNASPAYQAISELPDKIPLSDEYEATVKDVGDLLPPRIRAKLPEGGEITGQQAVDLTKMLRNRAAQLDRSTGITAAGDIPSDLAAAHRDLAEGIEDSVRDHLETSGNEQLADNWNNARVYTAKSYSVENALDGAGNVKAADLKTQLFKKGTPLSGGLEDIANLAAQYPEAFKITRITQPQAGLVRRAVAGAFPYVGGAAGAAIGGTPGAGIGVGAGEYAKAKMLNP